MQVILPQLPELHDYCKQPPASSGNDPLGDRSVLYRDEAESKHVEEQLWPRTPEANPVRIPNVERPGPKSTDWFPAVSRHCNPVNGAAPVSEEPAV